MEGRHCNNCYRNNHIRHLNLNKMQYKNLNKKKKFRFIRSGNNKEYIHLCDECTHYLTEGSKTSQYKFMWQSFIWYLLTNEQLLDIYGTKVWKFLPTTLREWWFVSVFNNIPYFNEHTITLEEPPAIFYDNTDGTNDFTTQIRSHKLGNVTSALNKYLLPKVLCPWGCSEYNYESGNLPFNLICQRSFLKVKIKTIHKSNDLVKIYSSRDDYIRYDVNDYDCWVFNPDWQVTPNVIRTSNGLQVCTCRHHNGVSKKLYIHTPRTPHHLPSQQSDQLCHAIIKSRIVKNFKASAYSNSYQMNEQRGSFQGVDTCDICNFGDFTFKSRLLSEFECRSVSNRADINDLLDKYEKYGYISNHLKEEIRENAKQSKYSYTNLKKYLQ
jgi:hypothetical protein